VLPAGLDHVGELGRIVEEVTGNAEGEISGGELHRDLALRPGHVKAARLRDLHDHAGHRFEARPVADGDDHVAISLQQPFARCCQVGPLADHLRAVVGRAGHAQDLLDQRRRHRRSEEGARLSLEGGHGSCHDGGRAGGSVEARGVTDLGIASLQVAAARRDHRGSPALEAQPGSVVGKPLAVEALGRPGADHDGATVMHATIEPVVVQRIVEVDRAVASRLDADDAQGGRGLDRREDVGMPLHGHPVLRPGDLHLDEVDVPRREDAVALGDDGGKIGDIDAADLHLGRDAVDAVAIVLSAVLAGDRGSMVGRIGRAAGVPGLLQILMRPEPAPLDIDHLHAFPLAAGEGPGRVRPDADGGVIEIALEGGEVRRVAAQGRGGEADLPEERRHRLGNGPGGDDPRGRVQPRQHIRQASLRRRLVAQRRQQEQPKEVEIRQALPRSLLADAAVAIQLRLAARESAFQARSIKRSDSGTEAGEVRSMGRDELPVANPAASLRCELDHHPVEHNVLCAGEIVSRGRDAGGLGIAGRKPVQVRRLGCGKQDGHSKEREGTPVDSGSGHEGPP